MINTIEEVACTDPLDSDSDNDGLLDGIEDQTTMVSWMLEKLILAMKTRMAMLN